MKKNHMWIGAGVIVVVIALACLSSYNSIVRLDQAVTAAWAQVETDYQRRSDLVPNLVATVKGAIGFETKTLLEVTQARANATSIKLTTSQLTAENISSYEDAQAKLGGSLGRLIAIAENYPTLTATESFRGLQTQLEGTENRIAVSRKDFNSAVEEYNATIKTFPNALLAPMYGFAPRAYFESGAGSETAPEVAF
ncbi:MAG: LemA family protein [Patescibacteria group bacterium]